MNLADDALECQSFTARIELERTADLARSSRAAG